MEEKEEYGRTHVEIRTKDAEELIRMADAAGISTVAALDGVIAAGLACMWGELYRLAKDWEGRDEKTENHGDD